MTIPVSTVPAALAYIFAQVSAAVTDHAVVVAYGEPDTNLPEDVITIGRSVKQTMEWHGLVGSGGAGSMMEEYEIDFLISVFRGGGMEQFQVASERAWALSSLIDNAVRADPTLGNLVQVAAPSSHESSIEWAKAVGGSPGPLCEIAGVIHVTVNIF